MGGPTLKLEDLHVEVSGREILSGVSLEVHDGEVHVIMGPNASGKTTLVLSILGHPAYKITKGRILFEGKDLSGLSVAERVKLGIGVAFQNPPAIRGVKLRDILEMCMKLSSPSIDDLEKSMISLLSEVGLEPSVYLSRDINVGFSGGEKKRIEIAQVIAMRPKLMIFDEPDTGIDIDSLRLVGRKIRKAIEELGSATIIITHYRHILPFVEPDVIHVLLRGKIVRSGEPEEVLTEIERLGYKGYVMKLRRCSKP